MRRHLTALLLAAACAVVAPPTAPPSSAAVLTCDGVRATIVGTARAETLRGTPRRDVIWAGGGNDVVRAGDGDDLVCGGGGRDTLDGGPGRDRLLGQADGDVLLGRAGDDRLLGGAGPDRCGGDAGVDSCDGGPLGGAATSPDDPDVCAVTVERRAGCRVQRAQWRGLAEGIVTTGHGLTETWSASYRLDPVVPDVRWSGAATIVWRVSGTDDQGCAVSGVATLPGRADLTVWEALRRYDHTVYRVPGTTASVTVVCPDRAPSTEVYQPLNTDAASGAGRWTPLAGALVDHTGYSPADAPEAWTVWSWSVSREDPPGT